MFKNKKFFLIGIGVLVLTLALGLVAFAPIDIANAAMPDGDGFEHGRHPGGLKPGGPRPGGDEGLAEALGIGIEDLQAAQQTARSAAVEGALAEGLITQAQADRLINGSFRFFQMLIGPDSPIDMDAYLAEALGISTDQLSEAREAAKDAATEQALADGKITEEQVAIMEAREALKDYIEKDELLAKALGITVEELEAAKEDGQHLPDLLETLGFDQETFEANMQAAHQEILAQAVEDGVITQEQADLLNQDGLGGMQGPGGHGRRSGDKGVFPGYPGKGGTEGSNFQRPNQSVDEG